MLTKVKMKSILPSAQKAVFACLAAASIFTQISCKDDDKIIGDGDSKPDPTAIIPTKGKTYTYKISEEDGTVSKQVTSVKSVKDSTGIVVYTVENKISGEDGESVLIMKSYSQNGVTTNEISLPAAYASILSELQGSEYVKDVKITGFPHYQLLDNKAAVNSQIKFKGEPIKLVVKLEFTDEDGQKMKTELESTLTYDDGKVTKVEDVTTPAGTFSCSKWEYSYTMITKIFQNGELDEQSNEYRNITEWTAPGVGIVKSIESDVLSTPTSTTVLQKID